MLEDVSIRIYSIEKCERIWGVDDDKIHKPNMILDINEGIKVKIIEWHKTFHLYIHIKKEKRKKKTFHWYLYENSSEHKYRTLRGVKWTRHKSSMDYNMITKIIFV